jgi:hypothetical protein
MSMIGEVIFRRRAAQVARRMLRRLEVPPDPALLREAADEIERILPDDPWAVGVAAEYRRTADRIERGGSRGR